MTQQRGAGADGAPRLSICVPTYNRPDLLERALRSVMDPSDGATAEVELVVSDNSTDERSEELVASVRHEWPGTLTYVHNPPGLGAEENFNRCLELASGEWVEFLHDDDYLVRGVTPVLDAISTAADSDVVLLFGVDVVDEHERRIGRQHFRRERRLSPEEALARVLADSSWVRFPALVARREAYDTVGRFDASLRNPVDLEMWIRMFSRFGVRCMPEVSCAYTVHTGALTNSMFTPETIDTLAGIFDRVAADGLLPERQVRAHEADFLHQFILGGTWRRLRRGDRSAAARVLRLFEHPEVRAVGRSARWAPVRAAFRALTMGAGGSSS